MLAHQYSDHWYAVPVEEIIRLWGEGKVPILKGGITEVTEAKVRLTDLTPRSKVLTVYLDPDPPHAWMHVLTVRGTNDIASRVAESREAHRRVHGDLRHCVDHVVINRFGDLTKTIAHVTSLIHSA